MERWEFGINLAVESVTNLSFFGEAMHSRTVKKTSLTANDISYIVNLICPRCGGPLGGGLKAFNCQGRCRKDWRPEWQGSIRVRMLNNAQSPCRTPTNVPGRTSSDAIPGADPASLQYAK